MITGASRGIGKGIAKRFADEGASLVLAANEPSVDAVAEEFRAAGAKAISYVCDVTNKAEVDGLYDQALSKFGKIDVSIQNAGVITIARIEDLPEKDWDKIMAVNTKGVFLCCQAAAIRMKPKKFGGSSTRLPARHARDLFSRRTMRPANLVSSALPRASRRNWPRIISPLTRFAPASLKPICGRTTTPPGASCSATINPASSCKNGFETSP